METFKAYIYDVDYVLDEERKAVIRLFGRTDNGEKICAIDTSFEPFFYVHGEGNLPKIQKEIEKIENEEAFVTRTEITTKKLKGKPVEIIKVYVNNPQSVPILKDSVYEIKGVIERYETDILFSRRYILEKQITPLELSILEGELLETHSYNVDHAILLKKISTETGNTFENPKIIAFDIETYTLPGKYSNSKNDPILTLSLYGEKIRKVISWKRFETESDDYYFVNSEAELIEAFIDIIHEEQPDYITGFFTDGFDFPYLKERAKKHNINLTLGTDGGIPRFAKGNIRDVRISGIPHLDLSPFVRNVMKDSLQTDSYSLDNVAKELLGEAKNEMQAEKIGILWDEGGKSVEYLCEYNLQDSLLTYKLAKVLLENISELSRLTGQNIHEVIRMSTGQIAEWYLIKCAIEENQIIPNKPEYSEAAMRRMQSYQGAYVFDPIPGVYEQMAVFDFRSLYPSIIVAHNVDPNSLTTKHEGVHATPILSTEEGENIQYYFEQDEAFIPRVLRDLLERRARIKDILKEQDDKILKARSQGLKLVTNSAYGLFGFFGARWYSNECAAAITAWSRYYVQKTAKKAEEEGYKILGGDTDSIFLALQKNSREDALNFIQNINKELPESMELELEDFYLRGLFVAVKGGIEGAKKKYAFINDKKKLKIKGFEAIRRDWSLIARNTQKEILRIILEENNPKKALDYVKKTIKELRDNKIDVKDLIIKTQIRKDIGSYENIGPHVRVAERMKQLGMPVSIGTLIEYVIVKGKGALRDKARIPEEAQDEYDSEYYINNQILPAVEMIFETVGYTKDDIIKGEQSSLKDYF